MSRLDSFRAMVARNPGNALARFGLATEAQKEGLHQEAVEHFRAYLAAHDDEGNAYLRLADSLHALGSTEDARAALRDGIAAATRFGHPGMAAEMEERLEELGS